MSDIAIRIKGLSKQYRLGTLKPTYASIGGMISERVQKFLKGDQPVTAPVAPPSVETIWALQNVSCEIKQGEIVGVIGRNGAGKSTMLKILSRITRPTTGRFELYGRVGSLLEVGTGFHGELTGRENTYLNGTILGMRKAEIDRKFDEIVDFAGVEQFIDTPVKRYSSGMYVRLAFAVSAHLETEILIVDEVLAVGDMAFQQKCLGKMSDISQSGRTILFVSHNMPSILRLCNRGIYLVNGGMVEDGPIAEVVNRYTTDVIEFGHTKIWEDLKTAPGNDQFKLTALSISKLDGTPITAAKIDEPVCIKLRYYVGVPNLQFRSMIVLYTQGVVAFPILDQTEKMREQVGFYDASAIIPANLLAEGEYTIGVSFFSSKGVKQHLVRLQDVVAFNVYDPIEGTSVRGDYAEGLGGIVRPMLELETVYSGNS